MEIIIADEGVKAVQTVSMSSTTIPTGQQVYFDYEVGEGGDEELAGGGLDLIDVVGGGFEDVLDGAQLPAIPGDREEADDLEAVELALGEGVKLGLGDLEKGAAEGLGVFGGVDALELQDPAVFLGSAGGNFEGLVVDKEDAAGGEAVGEVCEGLDDDAAPEAEGLDDPGDGDGGVGHGGGILHEWGR